jgi:hypothetical protein
MWPFRNFKCPECGRFQVKAILYCGIWKFFWRCGGCMTRLGQERYRAYLSAFLLSIWAGSLFGPFFLIFSPPFRIYYAVSLLIILFCINKVRVVPMEEDPRAIKIGKREVRFGK